MSLFHGQDDKRKISVPALILALLFAALAGSLLVNSAAANPIGYYYPWSQPPTPTVRVTGLDTDLLTLTFTVQADPWITPYGMGWEYEENHEWDYAVSIRVWVDGNPWLRETWTKNPASVSLEGLSNGEHTLEVTATAHAKFSGKREGYSSQQASSGVIQFQVDVSPPSVSVLTNQETFEASSSTADVPLNFTTSKAISWVGTSLDGKGVVSVTNYTVLTEWFGRDNYQLVVRGVPVGEHSLIVYAEDSGGNRGASEPFNFFVTQETPSETGQTGETSSKAEQASTLFPTSATAVAIAVIASAATISFGLVAYFLKRKRKSRM